MSGSVKAKAFVTHGDTFTEQEVTLPALGPNDILVRVHYAALNPTDNLAFGLKAFGEGAVLGCDFAGVVEEVGSSATKFSVGDRVASFVWGGEVAGLGAYAEKCIADERLSFKVPDNVTLEQASTIPLAAATAYLALFSGDCLGLKQHSPVKTPVLVLGGSSTVGSFTTQIATVHGIKTIATASKKNFQTVTDDGAATVFDYHDSNMVSQIKDAFPDLDTIFDTIGNPGSAATGVEILGSRPSTMCTVRPGKAHTENFPESTKVQDVFVFTMFPKEHTYRGKAHWPIHHENVKHGREFFGQLSELVADGKIKTKPVRSLGKLSVDALLEAMELLKGGKLSNEKVTFTVSAE